MNWGRFVPVLGGDDLLVAIPGHAAAGPVRVDRSSIDLPPATTHWAIGAIVEVLVGSTRTSS